MNLQKFERVTVFLIQIESLGIIFFDMNDFFAFYMQ